MPTHFTQLFQLYIQGLLFNLLAIVQALLHVRIIFLWEQPHHFICPSPFLSTNIYVAIIDIYIWQDCASMCFNLISFVISFVRGILLTVVCDSLWFLLWFEKFCLFGSLFGQFQFYHWSWSCIYILIAFIKRLTLFYNLTLESRSLLEGQQASEIVLAQIRRYMNIVIICTSLIGIIIGIVNLIQYPI